MNRWSFRILKVLTMALKVLSLLLCIDSIRGALWGIDLVFLRLDTAIFDSTVHGADLAWSHRQMLRFLSGPIGGTFAGFWFCAWATLQFGRRREITGNLYALAGCWALILLASVGHPGFLALRVSLFTPHGLFSAVFLAGLALLRILIALTTPRTGVSGPGLWWLKRRSRSIWVTWLLAAFAMAMMVGLATMFFGDSFVFADYNVNLVQTYFGAVEPSETSIALKQVLFYWVGAAIIAHYVVMVPVALGAFAAGMRWSYLTIGVSMALWFTIDSLVSTWFGASFNVWQINLPAITLTLIPVVVMMRKHP
ncbi:MAG: hypothetical protein HUU55_14835 [Myxococcales bacterium]|nr:hypothetical protein [Myxococcales bacterium]